MSEITLKAIKTKDTISFRDKKEYSDFLKEIPDSTELVITISSKRSLDQNRIFHKWVSIIASEMGEVPEAIKIWLLCTFAGCTETEIEGVTLKVPVSSSKLNKKEFSELLYNIDIWASENLNVRLPNKDSI